MKNSKQSHPAKVLYCEGNMDGTIGGSYYSLFYLVNGINKTRFKPMVIFHTDNDLIPKYLDAGIETHVIRKPKPVVLDLPFGNRNIIGRLLSPILRLIQKTINFIRFMPLTGIKYALFLRKHGINLVHLNNSIIRNNDWMLAAQLSGTRCITHERGINQFYPKMAHYYAKRLKAIICISNAVRDNLIEKGFSPGNLTTIYNGIDPDVVTRDQTEHQVRKRHGINENTRIIGVIGNIKQWKGQETVIRALPAVLKRFPNTTCLLVGSTAADDNPYKQQLQTLIEEQKLTEHVIFTGYTSNVANYISVMDIVLHTSIEPEPFGRVLIEAMSMSKPLIGTSAGAVPEIIIDGITGLTFEPGDHASLSTAVLRMLDAPEAATTMGKQGYQRLLEHFHIDINIRDTERLYDRILTGSSLSEY